MHPKLVANNGVFFHSIIYCFQSWEGKHTVAVADLSATATVSNEMAFFSGPRLNRPFLATFTTTPVNSKHGKMPKLPTSFYLDIVTTSVLTSNSNKNSRPKRFQHALNYSNFYHDSAVQSWGTFKSGRQAEALLLPFLWDLILWFFLFSFVDFFVSNRFFFNISWLLIWHGPAFAFPGRRGLFRKLWRDGQRKPSRQGGSFSHKPSFWCQILKKREKASLGGGFKYFLFSPLLGELIQFD